MGILSRRGIPTGGKVDGLLSVVWYGVSTVSVRKLVKPVQKATITTPTMIWSAP